MLEKVIDWACVIGYIAGFGLMFYGLANPDMDATILATYLGMQCSLMITNTLIEREVE
tara:strand:+ start:708 stop:881 length:174 start_codon:yes stop_codon:yes gene_type:complete